MVAFIYQNVLPDTIGIDNIPFFLENKYKEEKTRYIHLKTDDLYVTFDITTIDNSHYHLQCDSSLKITGFIS